MFGLVEVITLLLGLSGFGLQANPQAPTGDQALHYAMSEADIVVHVDVNSIVPGNYKALLALPNHPQIKASPELSTVVKKVVTELEGARGLAKATTGIDLTTDIRDATMFLQVVPNKDPNFVAAVRGKLSPTVIDKIAGMTKKQAIKVGGGMMIEMGGSEPAIAITKDGVMLAGTPKLVRDRLADTWRSPVRAANTNLGYAQDVINARPVFAVVFAPSATARKELMSKLGPEKNLATDLGARHKLFALSVFHDGIGWSWVDSTKAGLDQVALMSEGGIEILRASHMVPRGLAKILLGALDSYKGKHKRFDEIIKRKADIMKIVESYTGDGNFKVQIDKDPKTLRLTVRATGKSVSEVVPAGLFAAGGAAAFWLLRSDKAEMATQPPTIMPAPPATRPALPPKPAKRP